MSAPNRPPPGVSSLTASGARVAIEGPDIKPPVLSKVRPEEQHLRGKVAQGEIREVESHGTNSGPATRQVHEIRHNVRGSELGVATWVSADGETYRFRYKDARTGKFFPNAMVQMQLCIMREIVLDPTGRSAINVLSAFKLKMTDSDDRPLYPITLEMLHSSRVGSGPVVVDSAGLLVREGEFSLGGD